MNVLYLKLSLDTTCPKCSSGRPVCLRQHTCRFSEIGLTLLMAPGDQGTPVFVKIYYSLEARHQFVQDLVALTLLCC